MEICQIMLIFLTDSSWKMSESHYNVLLYSGLFSPARSGKHWKWAWVWARLLKCIRNFILDDGINPQFLQQNMIEKVADTEYWLNEPRISKVFSAGQFIGWLHGIVLRWIWQIMLCFLSNSSLQMSDNPVYYR